MEWDAGDGGTRRWGRAGSNVSTEAVTVQERPGYVARGDARFGWRR
jgi:hypothetical protein